MGEGGREWQTDRDAPANKLTLSAKPLALGDERDSIALLVNGQVATVAEDNGVCILTVPVIANGALAILLLAGLRLAVDGHGRARPRPVCLRRLGVRFRYPFLQGVPFLLYFRDGDLEDLTGNGVLAGCLAMCVVSLQPHVILLVHVVFDAAKTATDGLGGVPIDFQCRCVVDFFLGIGVAGLDQTAVRPDVIVTLLISNIHHSLLHVSSLAKSLALEKLDSVGFPIRRLLQIQPLLRGLIVDGKHLGRSGC